jgi:hypothetical protein
MIMPKLPKLLESAAKKQFGTLGFNFEMGIN